MEFRGTLFERLGKHGSRVERAFCVPWTESAVLAAFGSRPVLTKDDQQLWSAARYKEGASRGNAGLEVNYAAVLDRDCADVGELDRTIEHLCAQGLAFIVYTSWSHGRADKVHRDTGRTGPFDCFRVIIPYDREVAPGEHCVLVPALFGHELPDDAPHYAREAIGKYVELPSGRERAAKPRGWDPTSKEPARGYYTPTPEAICEVYQGRALCADDVLRRPTTAKPSTRRERPYRPPDARAVGALGTLEKALDSYGFWLGAEGHAGWRRAQCPSCEDPSPSLTARANGDGVDLRCHAGCQRHEVLAALGLTGDLWQAPSSLEIELEEQLERQAPDEDAVDADTAGELLYRDIRDALAANEPTVIQYPAGVGKSYQGARVISELVHVGDAVVYSTQEHKVAHETRMKLAPDVIGRSVHIHSPLIQVGDEPVCQRADELKVRVFDYGVSLMGEVCPRCRFRDDCLALAAARERQQKLSDAQAIFVSHAGIGQVMGMDSNGEQKGLGKKLIVDEMPGAFERVSVPRHLLEQLAHGARAFSADPVILKTVQEIARAWLAGETPGEVRWSPGGKVLGNAIELAKDWGRLTLREGVTPPPGEKVMLDAADALVRLCAHVAAGGEVDWLEGEVAAMLPDACHEALVQRRGVLLSATPMLVALPGFKLKAQAVTDGAPVRRVMVLRRGRGSKALTNKYYDDDQGVRVLREPEPGEEPGIPWPVVDEALDRALAEADKYGPDSRVLFVTFKAIADALREDAGRTANGRVEVEHYEDRRLSARIEVAHYGALRGKNDWEEGAEKECSVVYCLGSPRFNIKPTLYYLGLTGEAADQAWTAYAAGELTQAEGRLRLPRRKTPCTVFVEGSVAPSSWHAENITEIITEPVLAEAATALLEGALLWRSQDQVAESLDVTERTVRRWRQPGRPPPHHKHVPQLKVLARPAIREGIRLLATMNEERRATHRELFSWAPFASDEGAW